MKYITPQLLRDAADILILDDITSGKSFMCHALASAVNKPAVHDYAPEVDELFNWLKELGYIGSIALNFTDLFDERVYGQLGDDLQRLREFKQEVRFMLFDFLAYYLEGEADVQD